MRLIVVVASLLAFTTASHAFQPAAGNRAYPIAGHDMISCDYFDLEAYRGRWVFLEFWATW